MSLPPISPKIHKHKRDSVGGTVLYASQRHLSQSDSAVNDDKFHWGKKRKETAFSLRFQSHFLRCWEWHDRTKKKEIYKKLSKKRERADIMIFTFIFIFRGQLRDLWRIMRECE
jgi:hypothetical protein